MKIFLCHSKYDKTFVREIYGELSRLGFSPWLDEKNILPGQDWRKEITDAVKSSDLVLVFLSKTSVNKRGYLHKEISIALDAALELPENEIFIIPVRTNDCDVPPRLARWQWVDVFSSKEIERLLSFLVTINKGKSTHQTDLEYLDIPPFLQRQAD